MCVRTNIAGTWLFEPNKYRGAAFRQLLLWFSWGGTEILLFLPKRNKIRSERAQVNFFRKDIKYSENMIKYIKIVLLFMEMHDKMVLDNVNEKKGVEDERTVIG